MKQNIFLAIALVFSVLAFFGGATYVVIQGHSERNNICSEVQELRDDIVEVLDLAAKQNQSAGRPVSNATKRARTIISQPSC